MDKIFAKLKLIFQINEILNDNRKRPIYLEEMTKLTKAYPKLIRLCYYYLMCLGAPIKEWSRGTHIGIYYEIERGERFDVIIDHAVIMAWESRKKMYKEKAEIMRQRAKNKSITSCIQQDF